MALSDRPLSRADIRNGNLDPAYASSVAESISPIDVLQNRLDALVKRHVHNPIMPSPHLNEHSNALIGLLMQFPYGISLERSAIHSNSGILHAKNRHGSTDWSRHGTYVELVQLETGLRGLESAGFALRS